MTEGSSNKAGSNRTLFIVLGIGCAILLVLIMVFALALFGVAGGMAWWTAKMFQHFEDIEPATRALTQVQSHRDVVKAFGGKIEPTGFPDGTTQTTTDGSRSDVTLPIKGPSGTGTLHVIMHFDKVGQPTIETLTVTHDGTGEVLDLTPGLE